MDYNTEKLGYLPLHKEKVTRMSDCDHDHNHSEGLPLARAKLVGRGCR